MKNKNLIDLHIHTNNSDGEHNTKEILKMIFENNVKTFSITDHDNIQSITNLEKEDMHNLNYIRGVEISAVLKGIDMHILGYDFDKCPKNIEKNIYQIIKLRQKRILEIIDMLKQKYSIEFDKNDIYETIYKNGSVGKAHIINLLSKYGYGNNNSELYKKYLMGFKTETKYRINSIQAIESIRSDNGIAILAHPKEIENSYNLDIEELIKDLINIGINGIEVYNSLHTLDDIKRYLKIAEKYNLLISCGSDYHGKFTKPNVEIGFVSKEKDTIEDISLIKEIKKRH
jgi:predicted metal-dependent phosphoesterase TrpH